MSLAFGTGPPEHGAAKHCACCGERGSGLASAEAGEAAPGGWLRISDAVWGIAQEIDEHQQQQQYLDEYDAAPLGRSWSSDQSVTEWLPQLAWPFAPADARDMAAGWTPARTPNLHTGQRGGSGSSMHGGRATGAALPASGSGSGSGSTTGANELWLKVKEFLEAGDGTASL